MSEAIHPCCDLSTPSSIWDGTPRGEVISISGIETYIAHPPAPEAIQPSPSETPNKNRIILFLTEAHGIYLPNSQLLADSFASRLQCPVIMPDQFAGQARLPKNITPNFPPGSLFVPWVEDPTDPNFELRGLRLPVKENVESSDALPFLKPPWWKEQGPAEFEKWKGRHEPNVTDPLVEKVVTWVHEQYGKKVRIGGVGYCFGGRYVMRLMGAGIVDVGVVNHPSFFTMEEVGKLGTGKPLAIYAAETDDILPPEKRREMEDVLTSQKATWVSTVFSGTEHGFSVRGDLSVKEVRLAKEKAFEGAVDWFQDWL